MGSEDRNRYLGLQGKYFMRKASLSPFRLGFIFFKKSENIILIVAGKEKKLDLYFKKITFAISIRLTGRVG